MGKGNYQIFMKIKIHSARKGRVPSPGWTPLPGNEYKLARLDKVHGGKRGVPSSLLSFMTTPKREWSDKNLYLASLDSLHSR